VTKIFKNAGAVFSLKANLVWCPKYRRRVLVGKIEKRLRELLYQTAAEHEWVIEAMEIMPDHVHLVISFDPRYAVAEIVNRCKGITSRNMRAEFRELRSRIPALWSGNYYAGTVGHVSEAAVHKYIESQKGK
jgi:putative transposase